MLKSAGLLLLLITYFACFATDGDPVVRDCPSYRIITDWKTTHIKAVVSENVSEAELKCVLVKIADEHQFDPDRDYEMFDNLWVAVHLQRGDQISADPAGKLRRYVPIDRKETEYVPANNKFYLTRAIALDSF